MRESIRCNMDTVVNGALLSKSPKEVAKKIEDTIENNPQWISSRTGASQKKPVGVVKMDAMAALVTRLVALR